MKHQVWNDMIYFTKIKWKNFLSTGNIFTEIVLNKNKNTLIIGENGSGKSTLLDALTFALFGKAFRNINKPQLLNTINRKDMVVELYFNIGSNHYKIIRGIKPNIFEVYMNDVLLNQSAESKDYQEILEKQIIKVNYKSFCQVVVLGSATFQPFMQLAKGQRREVIEDLLDLQIFTNMNSILKNKISLNNEDINQCVLKQNLIEQKIKLIQEHLLELEKNNTEIIEEKKLLLNNVISDIEKYDQTFIDNNNEIKLLKSKIKSESKIKTKIKEIEKLKNKIEVNLSLIQNEIDFFNNHKDCPTCKQSIEESFKDKILNDKILKKEEIDDGLKKLFVEYKKTNDKLTTINSIIDKINNLELEEFKIKNKLSHLKDKKEQLENEIKKLQHVTRNENDTRISDLEIELKGVNATYKELIDLKNIYNASSLLLKDNGIKSRIIKQYIPVINKLINKYLSSLDFFVQFELNEEFEETIKSRYRDVFSYASFSEGEKMKINLAILFTWRAIAKLRNSINTNLLIMDEVFDSSLDSNGVEEFIKILNDMTGDSNTFIISHKRDQLLDKFENVIKFEKKKNFSKINKGV